MVDLAGRRHRVDTTAARGELSSHVWVGGAQPSSCPSFFAVNAVTTYSSTEICSYGFIKKIEMYVSRERNLYFMIFHALRADMLGVWHPYPYNLENFMQKSAAMHTRTTYYSCSRILVSQ